MTAVFKRSIFYSSDVLVCNFILISSLLLFITCVFVLPVLIIIVWSFHHINHLKCLPKTLPTLVNPVRWVFGSFKYLDITYKFGSCYMLALHASLTVLLTTVMAMATHCTISVVLVAPKSIALRMEFIQPSPAQHGFNSQNNTLFFREISVDWCFQTFSPLSSS